MTFTASATQLPYLRSTTFTSVRAIELELTSGYSTHLKTFHGKTAESPNEQAWRGAPTLRAKRFIFICLTSATSLPEPYVMGNTLGKLH
jgi:hypothetical protein